MSLFFLPEERYFQGLGNFPPRAPTRIGDWKYDRLVGSHHDQ